MAVKLIAVDMDGTFLNSEKEYNRERFSKLFTQMKEKNVRFVCASGNQFPQLKYYLEDYHDQMTFIAENGAYIIENGKELDSALISMDVVSHAIHTLREYGNVPFILCGKNGAYVHTDIPSDYYKMFLLTNYLLDLCHLHPYNNKKTILSNNQKLLKNNF